MAIAFAAAAAARTRVVLPPKRTPTFSREIVRIFQQNCQSCHSPGGIGPFSLTDYRDAFTHSLQIKIVTGARKMPPWKPEDGCGEFADARRLTQQQIDLIGRWVDAGAPEGDPVELPAPVTFSTDWSLGVPDLVLTPAESYVASSTSDTFRCFVLPAEFAKDTYVTAIDIRPEARDFVHHAEVFIDTTGRAAQLDANDPEPGFDLFSGGLEIPFAFLGAWLPSAEPFALPGGVAIQIPRGAKLVLAVHYHPHNGIIGRDRTSVGLYLAHSPIEKLAQTASFYVDQINLPAGASNIVVQTTKKISEPMDIYAVRAHMHYLGREISTVAKLPDGSQQCLLNIDDWDIHWQGIYRYRSMVQLPTDTLLTVSGLYDNSILNPNNPNFPPRDVHEGYLAADEMCGMEFVYTPAGQRLFIVP